MKKIGITGCTGSLGKFLLKKISVLIVSKVILEKREILKIGYLKTTLMRLFT